jgi:hypothetical protein
MMVGSHVVEYAQLYSGGQMLVRNPDPEIDAIFPLDKWIKSGQRFGGMIYKRTIEIVEDWEEVPRG